MWGSAAAEAPPGAAREGSPALRLLERLTDEARSELGVLGPALEQLFAAVRAQLERWARIPTLHRIIVSHGPIIEKDPSTVLDRVAHALAA